MTNSDNEYREVYFDVYCKTCKFQDIPENSLPCNECLAEFANIESCVPVRYVKVGANKEVYKNELSKEEKKYIKALDNVFDI